MKNLSVLNLCSILLAIALLCCLMKMPYGYFIFIRYVVMVVSIAWAVSLWNDKRSWAWIAIAVAGLFQPFFKLVLGRAMWNAVDIVVAILLVLLVYYRITKKNR